MSEKPLTRLRSHPWGRFLVALILAFNIGMLIWFIQVGSYSDRQACLDVAPTVDLNPAYCMRRSDWSNANVRTIWLIGDGVFAAVLFAAYAALNPEKKRPEP